MVVQRYTDIVFERKMIALHYGIFSFRVLLWSCAHGKPWLPGEQYRGVWRGPGDLPL